MKLKIFLIFFISVVLFTVFQNCSKINLESSDSVSQPMHISGAINICLDQDLQNYTLESQYITNLNQVAFKNQWLLDSDADGIPDSLEEELGSDPLNRYSSGKILDSLCLSHTGTTNCQNLNISCNKNTLVGFGFNECDLEYSGLKNFPHPTLGLDSDRDGFVDYIEIIRGTIPSINDAQADNDKDLILNGDELKVGSNPNYSDINSSTSQNIQFQSSKTQIPGCSYEGWKLNFSNIEIISAPAFIDYQDDFISPSSKSWSFSRKKNENIIFISLIFSPKLGYTGYSKVYTYTEKILKEENSNKEISISFDKFKYNGDVLNTY